MSRIRMVATLFAASCLAYSPVIAQESQQLQLNVANALTRLQYIAPTSEKLDTRSLLETELVLNGGDDDGRTVAGDALDRIYITRK
jgi:hypothetical protein